MNGSVFDTWRTCRAVILAAALAVSFASAADRFHVTFVSEVSRLEQKIILPVLKAACGEGVRTVTADGRRAFGCGEGSMDEILASVRGSRRYPWMP